MQRQAFFFAHFAISEITKRAKIVTKYKIIAQKVVSYYKKPYLCSRKIKQNNKNRWQRISGNKIMKTLNELKSFCEKNNVRYEMNPIYSEPAWIEQLVKDENGRIRFTMVEHRTLLGYEFGMNNIAGKSGRSEWQWVWYESICFDEEPNGDTIFMFRNRYSMANGTNHKGWREEINAENTIERRMA